jgi:hypothetical protein
MYSRTMRTDPMIARIQPIKSPSAWRPLKDPKFYQLNCGKMRTLELQKCPTSYRLTYLAKR